MERPGEANVPTPGKHGPTWEEFVKMVWGQPKSKAPGRDCLNAYLITISRPEIGRLYHAVVNHFWQQTMPTEMTTASLIFLYKKEDAQDPKNFRPITLLPLVYKILASHTTVLMERYIEDMGGLHNAQHRGRHHYRA